MIILFSFLFLFNYIIYIGIATNMLYQMLSSIQTINFISGRKMQYPEKSVELYGMAAEAIKEVDMFLIYKIKNRQF
jgi:hypothetical protein